MNDEDFGSLTSDAPKRTFESIQSLFEERIEHMVELDQRILSMKKEVATLDWKDDKMMQGNNRIPYLSLDKIRANLTGLFLKHNLDFDYAFSELTPYRDGTYWTVRLDVRLYAVDIPRCFRSYNVYGESGNPGNMGVIKAQSFAFKQWLTNTFSLTDSIEDYSDKESRFVPMSDKEKEQVKSRIAERAISPPSKDTEPSPAKKDAGVSVIFPQVRGPVNTSTSAPKGPGSEKEGLSAPMKKGIQHILDTKAKQRNDGVITAGEYDAMMAEYEAVKTHDDALKFIRKHRA